MLNRKSRIWIRLIALMGLVFVCFFIRVKLFRSEIIVWSDYEGVGLITSRLSSARFFSCDKCGSGTETIRYPRFALRRDKLFYWVPSKKTVYCISNDRRNRHFFLGSFITPGQDVQEIRSSPEGILLNLTSKGDISKKVGVVSINTMSGVIRRLSGVVEAKSTENSDKMAFLTTAGSIQIRSSGKTKTINPPNKISLWDYSPAADRLLVQLSFNTIAVFDPAGNQTGEINVGRIRGINSLSIQRNGEVWLAVIGGIPTRPQILAYSMDGAYAGFKAGTKSPIGAPMYSGRPGTVELVEKISTIGK